MSLLRSFDRAAYVECRRELCASLLTIVARVRKNYPTHESNAACDDVEALLREIAGEVSHDELQRELKLKSA